MSAGNIPTYCQKCGDPVQGAKQRPRLHDLKVHKARGLCTTCYDYEHDHGRIEQWVWPNGRACREGVAVCSICEDATWLHETGANPATWADRIGTTDIALARLLLNHNRRELARPINRLIDARRRDRQRVTT